MMRALCLSVLLLASCSTSSQDAEADGGKKFAREAAAPVNARRLAGAPLDVEPDGTVCAVRAQKYEADHAFRFLSGQAALSGYPECVPSCGARPKLTDGWGYFDTVPAGACEPATPTCDMAARVVCPCEMDRGPLNIYRCFCESAVWSCALVSQGDGVCGGQYGPTAAELCSDAGGTEGGDADPGRESGSDADSESKSGSDGGLNGESGSDAGFDDGAAEVFNEPE